MSCLAIAAAAVLPAAVLIAVARWPARRARRQPMRRSRKRDSFGTSVFSLSHSSRRTTGYGLSRGSVLHELSHRDFSCSGEPGEQVALIVDRDLFRRSDRRIGQWNEGGHRAVFDAANPDTLLESGIGLVVGL